MKSTLAADNDFVLFSEEEIVALDQRVVEGCNIQSR
jgi:hypothetical protein